MLSCYLWSPLSPLHCQTCANQIQAPEGHPVCGHLSAPSDPDLLELLSEPQAVGTGPWTALLEFHSYLWPQRPELSAGAPGVCCGLTQSVSSGQEHGLPQQCWGVREGRSWGSDGCGSELAPRTPRHDRRNLTSCVCEQPLPCFPNAFVGVFLADPLFFSQNKCELQKLPLGLAVYFPPVFPREQRGALGGLQQGSEA